MIFRILDNLRKKPEPVRRQVVAVLTVGMMAIIISVWASTLSERFSGTIGEKKEKGNASPFSIFAEQGKIFYDSATDGVSAARGVLDNDVLPAAAVLSSGSTTPPVSDGEIIAPDLSGDSPF